MTKGSILQEDIKLTFTYLITKLQLRKAKTHRSGRDRPTTIVKLLNTPLKN